MLRNATSFSLDQVLRPTLSVAQLEFLGNSANTCLQRLGSFSLWMLEILPDHKSPGDHVLDTEGQKGDTDLRSTQRLAREARNRVWALCNEAQCFSGNRTFTPPWLQPAPRKNQLRKNNRRAAIRKGKFGFQIQLWLILESKLSNWQHDLSRQSLSSLLEPPCVVLRIARF